MTNPYQTQKRLKGWRYVAFISGIVGAIGLAVYPVIIKPMYDNSKYSKYYTPINHSVKDR